MHEEVANEHAMRFVVEELRGEADSVVLCSTLLWGCFYRSAPRHSMFLGAGKGEKGPRAAELASRWTIETANDVGRPHRLKQQTSLVVGHASRCSNTTAMTSFTYIFLSHMGIC